MKIAVIGYSGAGKSTLARALGKRYGIPVLHLDSVYHGLNWTRRSDGEVMQEIVDFLDSHDAWVIDGEYPRFHFERRIEEAGRIIIMDFNRFTCLWRVWKRSRRYRGQTRSDMAEGCTEKLDRDFLNWVLWKGRSNRRKLRLKGIREKYPNKVTVLKNQRQIDRFLEGLSC